MRLLLDTHALLWAVSAPERLSEAVRAALLADHNEVSLSIASLWEVAIKVSLRRLELSPDWRALIDKGRARMGARWLAVESNHCAQVAQLPWHHRDPFDRMLIAQAMCEDMTLISKDRAFADYSAPVLW